MKTSETKKTTESKKTTKKTLAKKPVKKVKEQQETVVKKEEQVKTCVSCSSCQDAATEAFIQEVTEEVKNDNLKLFGKNTVLMLLRLWLLLLARQ